MKSQKDTYLQRGANEFYKQQNANELQNRAIKRTHTNSFESYLILRGMAREEEENLKRMDPLSHDYPEKLRRNDDLWREVHKYEDQNIYREPSTWENITDAAAGRLTREPVEKIKSISKDIFENLFSRDTSPSVPWLKKTFD